MKPMLQIALDNLTIEDAIASKKSWKNTIFSCRCMWHSNAIN
ncbi:hypothetical protein [Mycoplasmopsis bovis]